MAAKGRGYMRKLSTLALIALIIAALALRESGDGVVSADPEWTIPYTALQADAGQIEPPPTGSIHGTKWDDVNRNGVRDGGESGLTGWTIYVDMNGDGAWQQNEPWAETRDDDPNTADDEAGMYTIHDVPEGDWIVREVQKPGWYQTYPGNMGRLLVAADFDDKQAGSTIGTGGPDVGEPTQVVSNVTANVESSPFGSNGLTIRDTGANGEPGGYVDYRFLNGEQVSTGMTVIDVDLYFDELEAYGVWVRSSGHDDLLSLVLYDTGAINANINGSILTNVGTYQAATMHHLTIMYDLDAGTVSVKLDEAALVVDQPIGLSPAELNINRVLFAVPADPELSGHMSIDNLVVAVPDRSFHEVTVADGDVIEDVNFGNWQERPPTGSIHGWKWNDLNGDGEWDDGEPGLAGVEIVADMDGQAVASAVTMDDDPGTGETETGMYWLENLAPGDYVVRENIDVFPDHEWKQTYPGNMGRLLVAANFDDKQAGNTIGTGGPDVGEPTQVVGNVTATVETTPFGSNGLTIRDTGANGEPGGSVIYWFLNDEAVSTGWVVIDVDLYFDVLNGYGVWVRSSSSDHRLSLVLKDTGDINAVIGDSVLPNVGTYQAATMHHLTIMYDLDAGTVSVVLDGAALVVDEPIGETPAALNRVYFALPADPGFTGEMSIDNLVVAVPGKQFHEVTVGDGDDISDVNFGNWREAPPTGSIHGWKWNDLNGDGEWDDGEPGLPGWKIYVDTNGDGEWQAGEPWAETMGDDDQTAVDETGTYWMGDVPEGQWMVREVWKLGWRQTYPANGEGHPVNLAPEDTIDGIVFGNRDDAQCSCILGIYEDDLTHDWTLYWTDDQLPDDGIAWLKIVATTVNTDERGSIIATVVDDLGTQTIEIQHPNFVGDSVDWLELHLTPNQPYQLTIRRTETDGFLPAYHYKVGRQQDNLAIGMNGIKSLEEIPQIWVLRAGNSEQVELQIETWSGSPVGQATQVDYEVWDLVTNTLMASGNTGTLTLDVPHVIAFAATSGSEQGYVLKVSSSDPGHYHISKVGGLELLFTDGCIDDIEVEGGSIHGAKWDDWNGDGHWDAGEPGLPGWTIYVDMNGDGDWQQGEPWAETMHDVAGTAQDETGMYWIDGVPEGLWMMREEWRPGWVQTYPMNPDYHTVDVIVGSAVEGVDFGNMVEHTGGICGDLDGDGRVTILDAIMTLQIVVGWSDPTQLQILLGDFDGVDGINVIDVVIFLQYLVGQIDVLDCNNQQPV